MVLVLSSEQLSVILTHAERAYPEECCGLIVGKNNADASEHLQKQVVRVESLVNQWEKGTAIGKAIEQPSKEQPSNQELTKRRRYSIDPKDMLRIQRSTREEGLQIIGIYHSHPDHVALPSECDRSLAWPEYAYTIVSVYEGKAVDVQNWALDSDHQFQPEPIKVSPSAAKDRMPVLA